MIYFVYGTLKKNHRLNWILEESEFIGECETLHSNFDIKDFPEAILPNTQTLIINPFNNFYIHDDKFLFSFPS